MLSQYTLPCLQLSCPSSHVRSEADSSRVGQTKRSSDGAEQAVQAFRYENSGQPCRIGFSGGQKAQEPALKMIDHSLRAISVLGIGSSTSGWV
jgi:hypothetical protein